MNSLAKLVGSAALGAMLVGAPLLAQDISIDYDHNFKFNTTKSYSWGKVETSDPLVEARVTGAIDRVLQGYGFKESVKNKKGDVIVTAVEANASPGYTRFYRGLTLVDWHRGWGTGGFADGVTSLRQVHGGTLVVDLYDGATGKLIWRGTAASEMPPSAGDTGQPKLGYNTLDVAKVDKTVNAMFANYPPNSGGSMPPNQHEVRLSPSSQGSDSPN
ncbi:MAG: DUF4136 domain-containing protein [Acidobacteriaceae bacterium]|jgi:hypothetical protein